MPNMDFQNAFLLPLYRGEYDEYLDNIIAAVHNRKKDMAPKIWEYQVGQIVKFNSNVRPKYLTGVSATVKKINRTKIVVDLDERNGRFFKNVTVPLSLVEKV